MTWIPVSGTVPQYAADGDTQASGYYLKGYSSATSTPLAMATTSAGTTTLAKCKLNAYGFPISNAADETSVFIPHFDAEYKLALYLNETDADNNTTANARWVVDGITHPLLGNPLRAVDSIAALNAVDKAEYDHVYVTGYHSAGSGGGGPFWQDTADTTSAGDGGTIFVAADGARWKRIFETLTVDMFGARGDGDGAGGGTDDSTAIQAALTYLKTNGGTIEFVGGQIYRVDSALTMQRGASDATNFVIDGNGAEIDCSNMSGSTIALTVGADAFANILTRGSYDIRNLNLIGPEGSNPATGGTTTTTTGLKILYAGHYNLYNVACRQFYKGCHTLGSFPGVTNYLDVNRTGIGLHIDEASNLSLFNHVGASRCRYSVLIHGESTAIDSGKINNVVLQNIHCENSLTGVTLDPGSADSAVTVRSIKIRDPYMAVITYDFFRLGTVFTYATPETRGAAATRLVYDVVIEDGLINPTAGLWNSATQACLAFGAGRIRHFSGRIPSDYDPTLFMVNTPFGGRLITSAFPDGTGDKRYRERHYDEDGALCYSDAEETVTGTVTLETAGTSFLDGSSAAVTATLPDGAVPGQTKRITMSSATSSSTVSVTNHLSGDPTVFTFNSLEDYLVLEWNSTNWHTIYSNGI